MPLQQFDERIMFERWASLTNTYTSPNLIAMGLTIALDTRIDVWTLANSDTIDHLVTFYQDDADPDTTYGTVLVPAGAGYSAVAVVDFLAAVRPGAQQWQWLPRAANPAWSVAEAINSGKFVSVHLSGGSF